MNGLQTNKAPSSSVVIPHFIFGAVSFVLVAILLLLSGNSFTGHYFQPKILAVTHLAVLGWASMIIFGSLYQLIPVILEEKLFSEILAKITFYLFGSGSLVLTAGFWNFSTDLFLPLGSIMVFSAILLFCVNIWVTSVKSPAKSIEADFILTSTIWLFLTGLLGILMTFNFNFLFFDRPHLEYLKVHANMGIAGWFLCLIMGVGSRLIPMFLVAHKLNKKILTAAYYSLNLGLIILVSGWLFQAPEYIVLSGSVLIGTAVILFGRFIYTAYKKRIRKQTDIGLKQSFTAMGILGIPLITGLVLSLFQDTESSLFLKGSLIYGTSVFLGFVTALILGQTYKTLPFIIWLRTYGKVVGKVKTPLPKELYSDKLGNWQFAFYLLAFAGIIIGIAIPESLMIKVGAGFLIVAAVIYNINILKMMLHLKPKIQNDG